MVNRTGLAARHATGARDGPTQASQLTQVAPLDPSVGGPRRPATHAPTARSLTARERDVATLIAEGLSAKEVASVLGVSYKTVEFHKKAIYDKLGLRHTAGVVRYAIRAGFVQA